MKKILGARTSKKLATLLSLGAIALPLVGCSPEEPQEVHEEEHKKLDISFCDTSNISAQNYYDDYVENYANGNTTYIIEQMEDIKSSYNLMRAIVGTFEEEKDGYTFNFDGTVMPYELKDGIYFYANGEKIKEVFMDMVRLKTADGYLKIDMKDNSYIIKNCDEKQKIETEITYGEDKSCSIIERNDGKVTSYEFDENGLLVHSKITGDEYEEKTYIDGNPNIYNFTNGLYTKEIQKDGSYIITAYGMLRGRLGYDLCGYCVDSNNYEEVKFYYDRNEKLHHVDARGDVNGEFIRMIAYPNGKLFYKSEKHDKDGNVVLARKIEQEYDVEKNSLKSETVLEKKIEEDGKMHTLTYKDDYTLIHPDNILHNCDWSYDRAYMARDGVVEIYSKDDFIYKLEQVFNGNEMCKQFVGHKVEENTITYADCNGKITRILSDVQDIGYTDYENNVKKYVKNLGENEIEVEFNGNNYVLEKDGHISCSDGENMVITYVKNKDFTLTKYLKDGYSELRTPGETIRYDAEDKIKSISKENYYVSYYDYDKNIIQKINENGISKEFFEDGCTVKSIENISCEEPYEFDGYELKQGSKLKYNENKTLRVYYYDKTKYIENTSKGLHIEIKEDGTLYKYDQFKDDNRLTAVVQNVDDPDNAIETIYRDYENNIIDYIKDSQKEVYYYSCEPGVEQQIYFIKCISDEAITVYDAEGKEYILEENDEICYHSNGHISTLRQGDTEYHYLSQNNSKDYFEYATGKYWDSTEKMILHHNDEILYDGSRSDIVIGYNRDGDLIKVTTEDGEVIFDSTKVEEQTENTNEIEDEER